MRKTLTVQLAEAKARHDVAVRATREKDVEIAKLAREAAGLRQSNEKLVQDIAAITRIAVQAKVDRYQMHNDLHALALAYLVRLPAPKRGLIARFFDRAAAAI